MVLIYGISKSTLLKTISQQLNTIDGNISIAIDAIRVAKSSHTLLSIDSDGQPVILKTHGNDDCHVILRGGKAPNFDAASVQAAAEDLSKSGLAPRLMIDASHANSNKKPENPKRNNS